MGGVCCEGRGCVACAWRVRQRVCHEGSVVQGDAVSRERGMCRVGDV